MRRVGIVIEDLGRAGAPWNYIRALAGELEAVTSVTPVVVYCRGDETALPDGIETVTAPARWLRVPGFADRLRPPPLGQIARRHDLDLIHLNRLPDIGHVAAYRASVPVVATVHGTLHWEQLPVRCQPVNYRFRRRLFDRLGRLTIDRCFAVSSYVADVLVDRAGYRRDQVTVTHEAINPVFFDAPPQDPLSHIPDEYLFHVSSAGEKKNLETVLRMLAACKQRDWHLVVAGGGWESRCRELASDIGVDGQVTFTGYVPQQQLLALYDNADCFVFPSLHETFGLPNVEAMARGAPVVTSACYAIPEIVGAAAVTVEDPRDASALRTAVEHVLDDQQARAGYVTRGEERAQRFRWSRHRRRVVAAYESVLD